MSDHNHGTHLTLTIEEEALRRSAVIDSPDYEFPGRLSRVDIAIAVVIAVISVLAIHLASRI